MIGSVVFLPVEDLERTRKFYTQILGLKLTMVQPAGAEIYDTGYGYWGFCAYGDGRPALSGDRGVCLSLNCRDRQEVDARWQRCLKEPNRFPRLRNIRGSRFIPAFWPIRTGIGLSCKSSKGKARPAKML